MTQDKIYSQKPLRMPYTGQALGKSHQISSTNLPNINRSCPRFGPSNRRKNSYKFGTKTPKRQIFKLSNPYL